MTTVPLWIDTDNALGSPFGDIDDAIAILALIKSGYPVTALSNIFGNTFQKISFEQTGQLLKLLDFSKPHYSGANTWWTKSSEASDALAQIETPIRILALGPLTNIALAIKKNPNLKKNIKEIIFVGTNITVQLPTWRFFDFNVYKDKSSALAVLRSGIPMTLVPCDQARKIRMTFSEVESISGPSRSFISQNSKRWFTRAKYLKFQDSIPVWDLAAVLYVLKPEKFEVAPVELKKNIFNYVHLRKTERSHIQTVISVSPEAKSYALRLLQSAE